MGDEVKIIVYLLIFAVVIVAKVLEVTQPPTPKLPPPRVRVDDVRLQERAICPVCRTAIEPVTRVVCSRCRTPHHADCWRYNARCATFACGERNANAA